MKTVSERVFGAVTYTSLKKVLTQVLSLFTFFVIVNHLSLKDYGLLNLLFAAAAPVVSVAMLGLPKLLVADISVWRAQGEIQAIRAVLREYALMISGLLAVALAAAYVFLDVIDPFYDVDLGFYYWTLVIFILAQIIFNFCCIVFESNENFNLSFYTSTLEPVVRTVIIICLFFWVGFTLSSVLWAYVIAKLAAALFSIPLALRALPEPVGVSAHANSYLTAIIKKHGKWEMFSYVMKTIVSNVPAWFVNFLVSTEGVALYAFVMKLHSTILSILPVRSAVFPILSHSIEVSKKLTVAIVSKLRKYLIILYVLLYTGAFVLAEPFIELMAPQYLEAAWLLRIAMLHLFIDVFTLGQPTVFYALKAQRVNFFIVLFASIMTIFMQFVGTYMWGVAGLIYAWLVVGTLMIFVREYILIKHFSFPLFNIRAFVTYDEYDRLLFKKIKDRFLKTKSNHDI